MGGTSKVFGWIFIFMALSFSAQAAERSTPKIISKEEARQAVSEMTDGGSGHAPESTAPEAKDSAVLVAAEAPVEAVPVKSREAANSPIEPSGQPVRGFTDAELGPPPSEQKMKQTIEDLRGKDTPFDPQKVEALRRKVDEAIESSPPERKAMLLEMQKQVNETASRLMRARQEQAVKGGSQNGSVKNDAK